MQPPNTPSTAYFIGLMSGTSADGIDGVLVDFTAPQPRLLATAHMAFSPTVREEILMLAHAADLPAQILGSLDVTLGRLYADVVRQLLDESGHSATEISAIGNHGQTIRHLPDAVPPFTLQIGDPNTLAEATGITVVADFRRRDMAAGGQGAPLVPAFHAALFRGDRARSVVNIGGMANLTVLPADSALPVTGFDTGPGNVLMDGWHARHQGGAFDANGSWAASGNVDKELLHRLLIDPYFVRPPPKSTGREHFSLGWLEQWLMGSERPEDVQATLLALTVETVAAAVEGHGAGTQEVIICGGGARNTYLMEELQQRLASCRIDSSEAYGVAPEWVEATAFAWLARRTLAGEPGNLPEVTGARHPVVLGAIYRGG